MGRPRPPKSAVKISEPRNGRPDHLRPQNLLVARQSVGPTEIHLVWDPREVSIRDRRQQPLRKIASARTRRRIDRIHRAAQFLSNKGLPMLCAFLRVGPELYLRPMGCRLSR